MPRRPQGRLLSTCLSRRFSVLPLLRRTRRHCVTNAAASGAPGRGPALQPKASGLHERCGNVVSTIAPSLRLAAITRPRCCCSRSRLPELERAWHPYRPVLRAPPWLIGSATNRRRSPLSGCGSSWAHGKRHRRKPRGGLRSWSIFTIAGNAWPEIGEAKSTAFSTKVTRHGDTFRLNGEKCYTTGSFYADCIDVGSSDEYGEGVGATVARHAPGVSVVDDWDGFGQILTVSGTATFCDVPVEPRHLVRDERDRNIFQLSLSSCIWRRLSESAVQPSAMWRGWWQSGGALTPMPTAHGPRRIRRAADRGPGARRCLRCRSNRAASSRGGSACI